MTISRLVDRLLSFVAPQPEAHSTASVRTNEDSDERLLEAIRSAVREILEDESVDIASLDLDTSLVFDLALDSLLFVDLTVALEGALGLPDLRLQEWVEQESLSPEGGFTARSLIAWIREVREQHQ